MGDEATLHNRIIGGGTISQNLPHTIRPCCPRQMPECSLLAASLISRLYL